jgi:hypothetical protein
VCVCCRGSGAELPAGAIPQNTSIRISAASNSAESCVDLVVATNNDTVVKSVIVFALDSGLFDGESFVVSPTAPTNSLRVPVKPTSCTGAVLRLQVLVAAFASSTQCHVFETTYTVRSCVPSCALPVQVTHAVVLWMLSCLGSVCMSSCGTNQRSLRRH